MIKPIELKYDTVTLVIDGVEVKEKKRYFGQGSLKKIIGDFIEENNLTYGFEDFYFYITLQSSMNKE
jgi:hypothetical protein